MAGSSFAPVVASVLGDGLSVRFRACGDSMSPAILNGDIITVAPAAAHEIASGDILLYRDGDRVLAHRVISLTAHGNERRFRLRGDANLRSDRVVLTAQIVGRVVAVERDGRSVPMRARPTGLRRTSAIMRRYCCLFYAIAFSRSQAH